MTDNITIIMTLMELKPDSRQYRQNSCLLMPVYADGTPVKVGATVPFDAEHILNYTEIANAQLTNQNQPQPILTAKGLRALEDTLGEYLRDPEDVKPEDLQSNEDWGDTSEPPKDETDWSDNASFDKDEAEKETEVPWDEDKENWNE